LDYYKIGQRIRKFRKAHRLSQEELAERADISTTHMSHIETGNTKLSLPVLVQIAGILEVTTDDLLTDGHNTKNAALQELTDILDHCTPAQARLITDIIRTTKQSLDKYL